MEKDKIRPERVPSAYSEMAKTKKEDEVEKEELKPNLHNGKNAITRSGLNRERLNSFANQLRQTSYFHKFIVNILRVYV
jgi:hypothetical protein